MENIRHNGVIESVSGCMARIRIARQSACSTCEAKATCRGHGVKDFVVSVSDPALAGMNPGDTVTVEMPQKTGRYAVLLGFAVPLALVVTAIIVAAILLDAGDVVAALAALAALVSYYGVLYVARNRLDRRFCVKVGKSDIAACEVWKKIVNS